MARAFRRAPPVIITDDLHSPSTMLQQIHANLDSVMAPFMAQYDSLHAEPHGQRQWSPREFFIISSVSDNGDAFLI